MINTLFGAEIRWFKGLTGLEKVKAVASIVLMCLFFVMICFENAPLWWYFISLIPLWGSSALAKGLPLDKLEEE